MQHRTKRMVWIAAALGAAGCAKSDFFAGADERMRMPSASERANAKEGKPPKILPDTYFAAGMLFERQGQFDKALLQYRKAVALNHNFVAAYHRLGLLQSAMGQHLESTESLRRAVALRTDNAILRNDLGFELMKAQRWDEAEGELRRAIELKPDLASAHINLALVHAKFERFTDSLASFQTVLPDADAYYNLGLMYRGQKRYAEAAMTFRRVLAMDPEFSAATVQLERLAMNAEISKSQRLAAETPGMQLDGSSFAEVAPERPLELFADRNDLAKPDPVQEDVEYAVENPHAWGTTLADLAAILAVLDAQPGRNSAEEPCEEEIMMPTVMPAGDNAVAMEESEDIEEQHADDESDMGPLAHDSVAELVGPPVPCGPESEEVDADDVIAALPSDPNTEPMGLGDSWAMLDELESKVALLWFETEALRAEKAHFSDWTLWRGLQQPPMDCTEKAVERGPMILGIDSAASQDQEDSDDSDVPFVEFQEDDALEQEARPAPSEAREEPQRKVPSPSERAQLWTTEFGDLNSLLWIVRNETDCLEYLDAASLELFALNEENGPWCVEHGEQAASIVAQEFTPEASNGFENSGEEHEPTARSSERTRNGFAAHQRGLEPLPD